MAAAQTEGRGRMGRAFYSPEGTGLYLSVLLHPVLETHQTPLPVSYTHLTLPTILEV